MKKILLFIPLPLIIIFFWIHYDYVSFASKNSISQKYSGNFFNRTDNLFCLKPQNQNIPAAISEAIDFINQKTILVNPIIGCLNITKTTIGLENKGLNGYFIYNFNPFSDQINISIDKNYQEKNKLLTALLLLHELENARDTLRSNQKGEVISCLDKEILAFKTQTDFLDLLTAEETGKLYLTVFKFALKDNNYETLRQVLSIKIMSNFFCFFDEKCAQVNSLNRIASLINQSSLYQQLCQKDDNI